MAAEGGNRGNWLREGRAQSATHAIEKAPQFRASLERFAERTGERLGTTFGALFAAALEKTQNANAFSALSQRTGQLAALLSSPSLDARIAVVFDGGAVEILIAAMFAVEPANDGDGNGAPRVATKLETQMIGQVADRLAAALRDAFAPVAAFELEVESVEILEDDALLGPKDGPALLAPLSVRAPNGNIGVTLILPHPFLTALGGAIARGPAPGAATLDPVWSSRMERRVTEACLTLTAILDEFQMSLADVSTLSVGQVLPISDEGHGRVRIECGERGVFVCSLGERNGRYALEIEDIIARPVESAYPNATPA